jgi:hypothetical protein
VKVREMVDPFSALSHAYEEFGVGFGEKEVF